MKQMSKKAFIKNASTHIMNILFESGYSIDDEVEITDDNESTEPNMWKKYIQQMQAITNGGNVENKVSICSEFVDENNKKFYLTIPPTDPIFNQISICSARAKATPEFQKTQDVMMDYAIEKGKNPIRFVRSFARGANKTVSATDSTIRIGGWDGAIVKRIDMTQFDKFFDNFAMEIYKTPDKKAMLTIAKDVTITDTKDFKYTGKLNQTFSYSPLARMIYLKTILTDITDEDGDSLDDIDFGRVQVSLEREVRIPKEIEYDSDAIERNYNISLKNIDMWFRTYTDMNAMFRDCQIMKSYHIKEIEDNSTSPLTDMIKNIKM